jgi:beta-phosphoglucomutase-like phosphatase (HAD superfamily)
VKNGKPHPEPFQLACERLRPYCQGLQPSECVAVEDSIGGIESAHSAGMSCLGIAHSYPRKRLEGARPRWIIESISEFKNWLDKI